jgi:hypothetical protein
VSKRKWKKISEDRMQKRGKTKPRKILRKESNKERKEKIKEENSSFQLTS